jgi:hypothetical protein
MSANAQRVGGNLQKIYHLVLFRAQMKGITGTWKSTLKRKKNTTNIAQKALCQQNRGHCGIYIFFSHMIRLYFSPVDMRSKYNMVKTDSGKYS